jgi:hypothetical protein
MKRWEITVALRYLRARRKERFVSLIALIAGGGVAIGVMVLCIVMSVMTGFEEDLRDRILGFNPQIVLLSHSGTMRDYSKVVDAVRAAPGVAAAAPFVYGQVMVSSDSVSGAVVRGVEPDRASGVVDVKKKREGRPTASARPCRCAPSSMAKDETNRGAAGLILRARGIPGRRGQRLDQSDVAARDADDRRPGAAGQTLRGRRDLHSGMYDYDSTIVFMAHPTPSASSRSAGKPPASVRVGDIDAARVVARHRAPGRLPLRPGLDG